MRKNLIVTEYFNVFKRKVSPQEKSRVSRARRTNLREPEVYFLKSDNYHKIYELNEIMSEDGPSQCKLDVKFANSTPNSVQCDGFE